MKMTSKNVCAWLKAERLRQGVTLRRMAARVHMAESTLCVIEGGRNKRYAMENVELIADALGYELHLVRKGGDKSHV